MFTAMVRPLSALHPALLISCANTSTVCAVGSNDRGRRPLSGICSCSLTLSRIGPAAFMVLTAASSALFVSARSAP